MVILSILIIVLLVFIHHLYRKNKELRKIISERTKEEFGVESEKEFEVSPIFIEPQQDAPSDYPLGHHKTDKSLAIQIVNSSLGYNELSNSNTNFASINKAVPIWWFDINPSRFQNDLHLILAKQQGFIWVKIPRGAVNNPRRIFYIRPDTGLVQLRISAERKGFYLRDSGLGQFDFRPYVQKEFNRSMN